MAGGMSGELRANASSAINFSEFEGASKNPYTKVELDSERYGVVMGMLKGGDATLLRGKKADLYLFNRGAVVVPNNQEGDSRVVEFRDEIPEGLIELLKVGAAQ